MNRFFLIAILLCTFVLSCKKDPVLPDNFITFETNLQGFNATEQELKIKINFSFAVAQAGVITLNIQSTKLDIANELSINPAPVANNLTIPVAIGDLSKTIILQKKPNVFFDGDESISLSIASEPTGLLKGLYNTIKINFAEIVSSGASTTVIDGGGASFPNKVFIDLSANRMTALPRANWDLSFASDANFRVVLNASNGMLAQATNKSDIKLVTSSDTIGLNDKFSIAAIFAAANTNPLPSWLSSSIKWADDATGDITKTAIAEVSATDTINKVYIINPGTTSTTPGQPLPWKKIKISRKGNGYTLQHADINSTTFTEIDITKDIAFNYQFVSFTKGVVSIEPIKTKWDIAWTGHTSTANLGAFSVPYYFQDLVVQNSNKVQTAQVLIATTPYESFTESSLANFDFGVQNQLKIGASWRSGGGPTSAPAIRTDRYYIIKDTDGNIFKLKFNALSSNGERGKPSFEYALLKKA